MSKNRKFPTTSKYGSSPNRGFKPRIYHEIGMCYMPTFFLCFMVGANLWKNQIYLNSIIQSVCWWVYGKIKHVVQH